MQFICHHEGDERLLTGVEAPHQTVFDAVRIGLDAAGFDLLGTGALEAEIARREIRVADADRRTEGAAGEGTVRVELTAAGPWIEDRAGEGGVALEIRIGVRVRGVIVRQGAGGGVSWKIREEDREESAGALDDRRRPFRITRGELRKTPAEPRRVETVDRKRTMAAPGAPRPAGETVACAARRLGHGLLDDLEEAAVRACQILPAHRSRGYHPLPDILRSQPPEFVSQ